MNYRQQGFTLAELALVLSIASLMAYGGMKLKIITDHESQLKEGGAHMGKIVTAMNSFVAGNYDILTNTSTVQQIQAATTAGASNLKPDPVWRRAVPRIYDDFTQIDSDSYRQRYLAWRNAGSNPASVPDTTDMSLTTDPSNWNTCPDHHCVLIQCDDLKNWGYLPATESCTNPLGMGYTFRIRKDTFPGTSGPSIQYALDATVALDDPITDSNNKTGKFNDVGGAWTFAKAMPDKNVAVTDNAKPSEVAGIPASTPTGNLFAVGEIVAFGKSSKDGVNPGQLGWFAKGDYWGYPGGWPSTALVVARAGYWSDSPNSVYLRRDGSLPMTGPLNMGGNHISNLGKATLDAPCAKSGDIATIDATIPDTASPSNKLGAGYLLVCGYDQVKQGNVWKKATGGITGVEDAMAGMMDGYETGTDWVCWTHPTAPSKYSNVARMKFAMYQGKVLAFMQTNVNTWTNVTAPPGGYDLNVDYSSANPSYGTSGYGYNWIILYDPANKAFYCDQGSYGFDLGNPDIFVIGDWYFGPDGIKFQANGQMNVWGGTDANGTMGGIPVSGNVSGANCTYIADPVTGVQTLQGCTPNGGPITGQTTSLAGNRTVTKAPVKQTSIWAFQRKTKMNLSTCAAYGQSCSS